MTNLNLPDIPSSPMFIGEENKIMTIEWQEFFRILYERVGGVTSSTTVEIDTSSYAELYKTSSSELVKKVNDLEKLIKQLPTPHNYRNEIKEALILASSNVYSPTYKFEIWRADNLDPKVVKLPAANAPAEDEIDGFIFHRYNRSTEESVYHLWLVPDDFANGAYNVRGYFKLVVENPPVTPAGDENIVMGFEWLKLSNGDVFDFAVPDGSGTVNIPIIEDETALIIHQSEISYIPTTGWQKGDSILFRFYRDATNPADTYDNEAAADDNDAWVYKYHLQYKAKH